MKIRLLIFLWLVCAVPAMAQMQGLGIHFGLNDFYGPQTGNYFVVDQNKVNYNADNTKPDTVTQKALLWQPFVRVTYWFQLDKHWDLNLGLSLANLQYPTSKKDSAYIYRVLDNFGPRNDKFLGEFDARVNYSILPRHEYKVTPYVFAGLTASFHDGFMGLDVPFGAGGNVQLTKQKDIYFNLEAGYKAAITSNDYDHLQYTAGIVYWFKPHKMKPAAAPAPEIVLAAAPDMDNDGVPDSIDKCPTIPGLAEYNGCPDTDGDGVPDNLDKCPLVPGLKAFDGCPDTDHDGIPDNLDKCPYEAGVAEYNGCLPPDRDHDGVLDAVDKCPDEAGPASNNGCPVIKREVIEQVEKAARSVYFEEGKSVLKKASFNSLDKIAKVMNEDSKLYVDIAGYTDSIGSRDKNLKLSDDRANVCKAYLESKGIAASRITATGNGPDSPVASNKTALGRAQNRRTEFKLRNYKK